MSENVQLDENIIEQPVAVEHQIDETPDEDDFDYGPPRGTVAFIALMLIGYIIYYAIHYVEIFILRGGA